MYYYKLKCVKSCQKRIESCEAEKKKLHENKNYEKVEKLNENIKNLKQEKQKLIKELDGFLISLSKMEKDVVEKYYFDNVPLIKTPNNSSKKTVERAAQNYIYTQSDNE